MPHVVSADKKKKKKRGGGLRIKGIDIFKFFFVYWDGAAIVVMYTQSIINIILSDYVIVFHPPNQ